ncbi:MAG: DUF4290 domain-containing protein [Bacteroidetes bacterium]|nr:DUF4290 domain-containing protein [Bacteroidota bacterium]
MEYHTSLPHLILPEYGRNIQRMVDFAITVEDKEERAKVAKAIIYVMGQLNPHLRDVADFKHKLWDHLYIISDFKLDVESPYPKPSKETFQTKPDKVLYPSHNVRYRHYGNTVERLIEKASTYEEGDEKNALIASIANLMKRCYLTWNQETVEDVVILQQLEELSKGKLKVQESFRLHNTNDILARNKKRPNERTERNDRNDRNNNGRNRNNNNNRFHKRKY